MDLDPHLTTAPFPGNDATADGKPAGAGGPWPGGRAPTVLQVVPTLVTGGAERGCIDMALALQAAGGTPLVASEGGPMVRELDRARITHLTLPLGSKNPLVIRRNARRLAAIIRRYKVDIVHARSRAPAWSAWLACRATGARYMTTFHAPYNFGGRLKRWYNSVMARGERVIAISGFIRDHVLSNYDVDPQRVRVIHRGIDRAVFAPDRVSPARLVTLAKQWNLPDDRPVILLPGRLTRWKGQTVLIDALAKLGRKDVLALLVGSDQGRSGYRGELENRIAAAGLRGVVRMTDHCSDMAAAYLLSTVVVSASREPEAFGRVIVEAQAMGKPVIVSAIGAYQETVIPGETAWVVPPDDADALARALDEALSLTPEQRDAIGARAMAFVADRYTKDRMCADTLAVYAELLQPR
ncbi:glycosyltransferase family 4 protein [Azospirillum picis]|uniref:Glycosyltransferase involved in cell wall biosynthesis n=1 Tax=Azospirillum picis TaxID=488438 RepID=A0ABU0MSC8_9PROT|nr:glycosyltransferase family 4 protein [Azospirillum picis]MBP2301945.1 glycosyltransferase involved in cell wall biosynthesis [Azospirillum picis]MDQ0536394.1 glycosyltransferase involved in cell wall biosynthesis [Azospirillum picis]